MPNIKEAAVVIILNKGNILSIKRHDTLKWAFIGGKRDEGESIEETAIREVYEETGLMVQGLKPIYTRVVPAGPNGFAFQAHCFLADSWSGELRASNEGELAWLTSSHLIGKEGAFPEYNTNAISLLREKYPDVHVR